MKNKTYFLPGFLLLAVLLLASCSPRLNYLGDNYPPTLEVDVFYDQGDIKKDYRVIGQLNANNTNNPILELNDIKDKMIEEAKLRGANGIWFLGSDSSPDQDHFIYAKLLRYRE